MTSVSSPPSVNNAADGSSAPSVPLVAALRRLLRPLLRLLLAKGMTYPYLANLLKELMVEVAVTHCQIAGKAQTDSRLSVLTGIHRKDIRRLAHAYEVSEAPPASVSLGGRLIARWCGDALFLDASRQPRSLPRQSRQAGEASFERLVAAESTDIRARAVLDEWLRLGIVELDADDNVHLISDAFVPKKGFEEKAYFLGRNLHDHIAASVHNLLDQEPPFLERCVYYGQLSPSAVSELASLAEQLGMDALLSINRRARELRAGAAVDPSLACKRMTFGVYFFDETELDESDHASEGERPSAPAP
jgi:uncharacterized protein YbjQ (UPF0145 family)